MRIPVTIEEDIEEGLSQDISHRKLNECAIVHYNNTGENIKIPMNSIISKYRDYFDKYIDEEKLTEDEEREYRYSPKKFSSFMYGTTSYWSIILYINECHSILDFVPKGSIKYVVPEVIESLIEEILILEGID